MRRRIIAPARTRLVAIAGQVAMDEHGELVGPGDPVAQTARVRI